MRIGDESETQNTIHHRITVAVQFMHTASDDDGALRVADDHHRSAGLRELSPQRPDALSHTVRVAHAVPAVRRPVACRVSHPPRHETSVEIVDDRSQQPGDRCSRIPLIRLTRSPDREHRDAIRRRRPSREVTAGYLMRVCRPQGICALHVAHGRRSR
ncbi:Uncharacterised protein [Mycobacteroides abscessus subsp. abscessus]|nr:Uncharacterised protein [Mycobacteroides abscessus subsp. abscessus]